MENGIASRPLSELNRATADNISEAELDVLVLELFTYKPWSDGQIAQGVEVRNALGEAYKAIINNVPSGPTRTRALNMLVDCRQLANAAITFDGQV